MQQAVANGKRFSVYVTEARPDSHGELTVKKLRDEGIQATLLLDAAVGAVMERIDIVLVGAEGMCHACAISSASARPQPATPEITIPSATHNRKRRHAQHALPFPECAALAVAGMPLHASASLRPVRPIDAWQGSWRMAE